MEWPCPRPSIDIRKYMLQYWAGTPDQHGQTNCPWRCMRIGAAQRGLPGVPANLPRCLATAASHTQIGFVSITAVNFSTAPILMERATTGCCGWGTSMRIRLRVGYILVSCLDDPAPNLSGEQHDFNRSFMRSRVSETLR